MIERHYLMEKSAWEKHNPLVGETHWVSTDDPNLILVCIMFHNKASLSQWESATGLSPVKPDDPILLHAEKHPLVRPLT